jgi:hypothetical protein
VEHGRLNEAIIRYVHGLLVESAVNPIVSTDVLLNMWADVQCAFEAAEVFLSSDVILNESSPCTSIDESVEEFDQWLKQKTVGGEVYVFIAK